MEVPVSTTSSRYLAAFKTRRNITLPDNIIVSTVNPSAEIGKRASTARADSDDPDYSAHDKKPRPSSDTAYWAKIDPQYLKSDQSRTWCQPGMVIGIYPTGAGPAGVDALLVCVVTSRPSQLELPQPFVDEEEEPDGLYLEIAVAVGVLGRVPVLMTDAVLQRFYRGGVSRELFWTEEGVDFEDDTHKVDYTTAKFIGDADFDKGRFDEHGQLKMEFQNVRAVSVLISYRAVSMAQIGAKIDMVMVEANRAHDEVEALRQTVMPYLWALIISALLFVLYLYNQHLVLEDHHIKMDSVMRAVNGPKVPFAHDNFKPNTTIIRAMPDVRDTLYHRAALRAKGTEMLLGMLREPRNQSLLAPMLVLRAPDGMGKSTEALGLVQQPAVYQRFSGGVYFIDCTYGWRFREQPLQQLAKQMFCAQDGTGCDLWDASVDTLVTRLKFHIAAQGPGRQVLVLLENCDYDLVKHVAKAVGSNGVVVVTTSLTSTSALQRLNATELVMPTLSDADIEPFLTAHGVSHNATNQDVVKDVLDRTHGVPFAVALVSALYHPMKGNLSWNKIAMLVDMMTCESEGTCINTQEPQGQVNISRSVHACIAASLAALNFKLRQKMLSTILLPVGVEVPVSFVHAMWGGGSTSADLNTLDERSLLVYDRRRQTVRIHDLVKVHISRVMFKDSDARDYAYRRFKLLVAHILSPAVIGSLADPTAYFFRWHQLKQIYSISHMFDIASLIIRVYSANITNQERLQYTWNIDRTFGDSFSVNYCNA